ncbi:MFS transporter [Microvirga flavescens]|uniref:MFS transporter n=1 Tax=Microvirga flavescens TaxID=2249811 RepID=UPI000DD9ADCF|nr:MFS transporter [Microvirga flavescens]
MSSTPARMPWGFVMALSWAQLVAYGVLFYAFALFIEPMGQELGWSKSALAGAYSLALGTSAFLGYPVGRLVDRGHGRMVMVGGALLATVLLLLWSRVESYAVFLLIWAGIGVAMSGVFYDVGFAVLARRVGLLLRRGITVMTLIGGFASTVFIPLTHWLIEAQGWRGALVSLAILNLVFCAGLSLISLPKAPPRQPAQAALATTTESRPHPRWVLKEFSFWGFIVTLVLQGIISTGLPIHLIPFLTERGFSLEMAVAAYSIIGPAQVAARFVAGFGERGLSLKVMGFSTLVAIVLSFALISFIPAGSWLIFVFAALYGAGNGLMTIVRSLLPRELFGREDYGAIQGMIATPVRLAMAAAPFAIGALWALEGSYGALLTIFLLMSLGALGAFMLMVAPAVGSGVRD